MEGKARENTMFQYIPPELLAISQKQVHAQYFQRVGLLGFVTGVPWESRHHSSADMLELIHNFDRDGAISTVKGIAVSFTVESMKSMFQLKDGGCREGKIADYSPKTFSCDNRGKRNRAYPLQSCLDNVIKERLGFQLVALYMKGKRVETVALYQIQEVEESVHVDWGKRFTSRLVELIAKAQDRIFRKGERASCTFASHLQVILHMAIGPSLFASSIPRPMQLPKHSTLSLVHFAEHTKEIAEEIAEELRRDSTLSPVHTREHSTKIGEELRRDCTLSPRHTSHHSTKIGEELKRVCTLSPLCAADHVNAIGEELRRDYTLYPVHIADPTIEIGEEMRRECTLSPRCTADHSTKIGEELKRVCTLSPLPTPDHSIEIGEELRRDCTVYHVRKDRTTAIGEEMRRDCSLSFVHTKDHSTEIGEELRRDCTLYPVHKADRTTAIGEEMRRDCSLSFVHRADHPTATEIGEELRRDCTLSPVHNADHRTEIGEELRRNCALQHMPGQPICTNRPRHHSICSSHCIAILEEMEKHYAWMTEGHTNMATMVGELSKELIALKALLQTLGNKLCNTQIQSVEDQAAAMPTSLPRVNEAATIAHIEDNTSLHMDKHKLQAHQPPLSSRVQENNCHDNITANKANGSPVERNTESLFLDDDRVHSNGNAPHAKENGPVTANEDLGANPSLMTQAGHNSQSVVLKTLRQQKLNLPSTNMPTCKPHIAKRRLDMNSKTDSTSLQLKKSRRVRRKWSKLETDYLVSAVNKYGEKWSTIVYGGNGILVDRTGADCKDKWRKLTGED